MKKHYSVDDKVKFNQSKKTPWSYGYIFGVKTYRSYPTFGETTKKRQDIKSVIDHNRQNANSGNKSGGVEYSKGFMAGVRDAARERKNKK